jgi:hypothetical protein
MWNVRNRNRLGSLKGVARELTKYELDLVGAPEVKSERGDTDRREDYTFFC